MLLSECNRCHDIFERPHDATNIICPACSAMLGYWVHPRNELGPFKVGDTVEIPKGTKFHSTRIGNSVTKRTMKFKINQFICGSTHYCGIGDRDDPVAPGTCKYKSNPTVTWVGSGSYWHRCDINDVKGVSNER